MGSENSDQAPSETLVETIETKDDVPIYIPNQSQKTPPLSPEKSTTPTEVVVVSSCDPRKPIVLKNLFLQDKLIVKTCQLKKIYNPFGEQFLCWDRQDYLLKQCFIL